MRIEMNITYFDIQDISNTLLRMGRPILASLWLVERIGEIVPSYVLSTFLERNCTIDVANGIHTATSKYEMVETNDGDYLIKNTYKIT